VELLGGQGGDGAVGGGAKLKGALDAVVLEEAGAGDFGKLACSVTAEEVHLEETILRGDKALGDDEVIERGGSNVGDAMGIALNGDGSGETRQGKCAVYLRERGDKGVVDIAAKSNEAGDPEDEED